jgi:hypothetical protein
MGGRELALPDDGDSPPKPPKLTDVPPVATSVGFELLSPKA